jgi:hypothetical protein
MKNREQHSNHNFKILIFCLLKVALWLLLSCPLVAVRTNNKLQRATKGQPKGNLTAPLKTMIINNKHKKNTGCPLNSHLKLF